MAGASQPGEAALQRAAALFGAGRLDEARSSALELLASQPQDFLVLHLLGAIAVRAGRAEEALDYETRALSILPHDAEALCNLGIALRMLGRVDEALADYDRVLAAKPGFMPALNLRGVALAALNRHREAIASYDKAASIDERFAPARFNRSLSELVTGEFERGWRDFEFRWGGADTKMAKREFGKPQWRGEDPSGKTILVSKASARLMSGHCQSKEGGASPMRTTCAGNCLKTSAKGACTSRRTFAPRATIIGT